MDAPSFIPGNSKCVKSELIVEKELLSTKELPDFLAFSVEIVDKNYAFILVPRINII